MSRLPLALTAATVLTVGLASPATAGSVLEQAVISSNADPTSSGRAIERTLGLLAALGSSDVPLSSGSSLSSSRPPLDESITEAAVVEKRVESDRVERWIVASPAMKRNVEVQIWRAAGDGPAPMLYLLDGVGAPRTSWWLGPGIAPEVFAGENVTLVMPTQAQASMYADWLHDDPTLGRHQWETFLTAELAPLLDTAPSSTSTATAPSADCPWVPPVRSTSPTGTPTSSTPPSGSPAATRPWIRSAGRTPT